MALFKIRYYCFRLIIQIILVYGTFFGIIRIQIAAAQNIQNGDFYMLSLSWSPSYCAFKGTQANHQQCASGRNYSFIVHGLWPQYEHGNSKDCAPGGAYYMPREIISSLSDIMPSNHLIAHEWNKHGRCSGLSPKVYFSILRQAYQNVTIPAHFRNVPMARNINPERIKKDFITVNSGLMPDGITVSCPRRTLQEVHICMTKALQFRSCEERQTRTCSQGSILLPPMR